MASNNNPQPESSEKKEKLPKNIIRALAQSEEFKMNGENTKALQIAEKILQRDPECLPAAEEVADNLLSLGKDREARKAAQFAYTLNTKSYIANYILGFTDLENSKSAVKYLSQANDLYPNNPEILRCLGWGLFHLKKEEEGIATLERALNIRPTDALILCDLGVCLLHKNIFDKSLKLFQKALSLDPESERAQNCLDAAKELKEAYEMDLSKFPEQLKSELGINIEEDMESLESLRSL